MAETRKEKIKRLEKSTKSTQKKLDDKKFAKGDINKTPKRKRLFPSSKMVNKKPQKAKATTGELDTTDFDRRKNIKLKRHKI